MVELFWANLFTLVGACGKVAGSGVLWKMIFGFLGFSTESDADHDVSPLSELAVQVYNPVSSVFKSEMVNSHSFYSFSLIFVTYRVLILVLLKNVFSIIRLVHTCNSSFLLLNQNI